MWTNKEDVFTKGVSKLFTLMGNIGYPVNLIFMSMGGSKSTWRKLVLIPGRACELLTERSQLVDVLAICATLMKKCYHNTDQCENL